uniref:Isoform 2 of Myelin-associated neurite-outgrowth inhibitor n=2 Tax=Homo sapiens TaxID=9606 RepID=A1KXE4-2
MNPVYSPGSSGVPYANAKGIGYPAGFPMGYAAAAPAYSPNMYPGANPTFQTGYTPGTPYKVSCSPTSGAVPPYSSSPQAVPMSPCADQWARQLGQISGQPFVLLAGLLCWPHGEALESLMDCN